MNHRNLIPCIVAVGLAVICLPQNLTAQETNVETKQLTTTTPLSRMNEDWWKERHELRMKEKTEFTEQSELDLLLVGDSITQAWETVGKPVADKMFADLSTFNLGFSGDRTEHLIWRLQNGELDGLSPKVAMLLIGTNNTGHNLDKPDEIAAGVKQVLTELKTRMPETRILLLAAFPYDQDSESPRRKNNNKLNAIIKDFHDGERVHYLDICDSFFDESGNMTKEVTPDFLHLSEAGYQIWADKVIGKIEELAEGK